MSTKHLDPDKGKVSMKQTDNRSFTINQWSNDRSINCQKKFVYVDRHCFIIYGDVGPNRVKIIGFYIDDGHMNRVLRMLYE